MKQDNVFRRRFIVAGQVQGVGFRPFVYRLATEGALTGCVGNTTEGVRIEVQGTADKLAAFDYNLRHKLPPLARLTACIEEDLPPLLDEKDFCIIASQGHGGHNVLVSPDMGICPDCLRDMSDAQNRRWRYAFTNCTNCGPRYTITRSIPYDRAVTSMHCFPLCPECAGEYTDPLDRRFHAQPNACPLCGPRLWLVEADATQTHYPVERESAGETREDIAQKALARAAELLSKGKIIAIKGLGGFLLACDATCEDAVQRLRQRKQRPHKPFAIMAANMAAAQRITQPSSAEEALLNSPEKPIVLCRKRIATTLAKAIAPDVPHVGIMLPYTPLHVALYAHCADLQDGPDLLVMTSGNAGGEPICLSNREALIRLKGMADAFLLHDRDILVRADDSVLTVRADTHTPLFLRRARGYVPRPIFMNAATNSPCVLACGAELKATMCLARGNEAFVSQHLGDMHNLETFSFFEEVAQHLEKLLQVQPAALVCDMHPDFMSTRYAQERAQAAGLPCITLQHHAAHAASVLAENHVSEPALVLTLDGTGLGTDGSIWGGELIYMDIAQPVWQRVGRLSPFALPGGDTAVREPWRIAQALLWQLEAKGDMPSRDFIPPWQDAHGTSLALLQQMITQHINCPQTSSCGRLFDAIAALLGLCIHTTYEGQAAIKLEAAVPEHVDWQNIHPCQYRIGENIQAWAMWDNAHPPLELDASVFFAEVLAGIGAGKSAPELAAAFHAGLALGLAELASHAAKRMHIQQVGLSGGVLQNATLTHLLSEALSKQGLSVLCHHELPAGDGGLALGQAAWGQSWLKQQSA